MMRKLFDWRLAAMLAVAMAAPSGALAQAPADAVPVADDATPMVPMVKVEIQHRGQVIKTKPQRLDWDETGAIRLERGKRVHDVTLQVTRKGDSGKKLHVTLSYELDGELVIEDFAYDTKAKKREVLRTDGVALAVTVTPRPLQNAAPTERENKLDPPVGSDDPLAGL